MRRLLRDLAIAAKWLILGYVALVVILAMLWAVATIVDAWA